MKTYDLEDTGRGGYEPHYQLVESVDYRKAPDGLGEWVRREDSESHIRELEAALLEAKEIVKVFHDMGSPKHMREEMWALYQQSPEMKRLNAALAAVETPADDLDLQPTGHCDKCGRKVWKASTLGQIDEMLQPGGGICGGRFISDRASK